MIEDKKNWLATPDTTNGVVATTRKGTMILKAIYFSNSYTLQKRLMDVVYSNDFNANLIFVVSKQIFVVILIRKISNTIINILFLWSCVVDFSQNVLNILLIDTNLFFMKYCEFEKLSKYWNQINRGLNVFVGHKIDLCNDAFQIC